MTRTRVAVAATMSLAWLAACDAPAVQTAPDVTASMSASDQGLEASGDHRHSFELRDSQGVQNAARPGGGSGTGISYHGGTVLQGGINVVAVYWGSTPVYNGGPSAGTSNSAGNSGDASVVGQFLRDIDGSAYYNINSTYKNAAGTALVNAVKYTGYWANSQSVPTNGQNVSDANMIAMLQSGFNSGALKYDANTLYAVFTAGTVNLGGGAGTQYCAYHTNANVVVGGVSKRIYYAAMPYNAGWPSGCTSGLASPNNDVAADAEVNTLIHEIEETQTDAMGNAWYDNRGYENADKCAWQWGTTFTTTNGGKANITPKSGGRSYLVQMNWINANSGGCRISWP
jgi:hypothetical protein